MSCFKSELRWLSCIQGSWWLRNVMFKGSYDGCWMLAGVGVAITLSFWGECGVCLHCFTLTVLFVSFLQELYQLLALVLAFRSPKLDYRLLLFAWKPKSNLQMERNSKFCEKVRTVATNCFLFHTIRYESNWITVLLSIQQSIIVLFLYEVQLGFLNLNDW